MNQSNKVRLEKKNLFVYLLKIGQTIIIFKKFKDLKSCIETNKIKYLKEKIIHKQSFVCQCFSNIKIHTNIIYFLFLNTIFDLGTTFYSWINI